MNLVDGRQVRSTESVRCDVAVVGSGPAGAALARSLAMAGLQVVVLEEGPFVPPEAFMADGFSAMAGLYRNLGASLMSGRAPMPYVQGRAVGGTSVVNGAISWRLPQDVHATWLRADPALEETLGWERLEGLFDAIERDLHIAPTAGPIRGANNDLLAKGAEALGISHRPIWRNVKDCEGLGRCLQGCPRGHKMSMDRSYLPEACRHGTTIWHDTRVSTIAWRRGRATGVRAVTAGGGRVSVLARRAVVLAASAIQTPALLIRSGLCQGPVGRHLQCHPGLVMAGRFAEPVRLWTGATQGHEVVGLRQEGLKFEALGYDQALVAARMKSIGRALARDIADMAHWAHWGVAVRASAEGRVAAGWGGPQVRFGLNRADMLRVRRGVRVLGELMLAAGAEYVTPGVHGWHAQVSDRTVMARFEAEGPLDPRAYAMAATHLFGTCRMGSDPATSVVRPDFRHHAVSSLYVADSSVFPSNTGVNPQTSILALACRCAESLLQAEA